MALELRNRRRLILINLLHAVERRELLLERRRLRDNFNPFDVREIDFMRLFRVTKDIALFLCEELAGELIRQRSSSLHPRIRVLITLRFLAEGSYQRGVGQDFLTAVSQPTVSKTIRNVTKIICRRLLARFVKFPHLHQEKTEIERRFRLIVGFPGVIGAIDCTHIAIMRPRQEEANFYNHKGYHSLNVQMITDDQMRIMHVCAYAGSTHDQFIWNWSRAKREMVAVHEEGHRFYLLGDSGYGLEPWLLTPLPNAPEGSPAFRYTMAHCRTRCVVERAFGVLKARWRCLIKDRVLQYSPNVAKTFVCACAILHNIMLDHGMELPDPLPPEIVEQAEDPRIGEPLALARRYQAEIIHRYFA